MSWLAVAVLVVSFVVLLAIGVPIAFCLGISTTLTMLLSADGLAAVTAVAQRMATGVDSFTLLAIPFFVLAGQLMNQGGIARRLVDFAKAMLGMLPGALAFVNVLAAMLFGAVSGSAVAAASAVGGFMGPQMKKEGYDKNFSAAVNITSASTGLIIPPSNVLIVYSLAAGGVSIGALFLAGYLPGLLVGLSLMVVAAIWAYRYDYPTSDRVSLSTALWRFVEAIPSLFMLVVVIGGIVAGIFTATEAAAVAVLYAFLLALVYREIDWADLHAVLLDTVNTSAIVLLLVGASIAMSWVLSYEQIPQGVAASLVALTDSTWGLLLIINILLLVVGTFMDITPAVLIFTPIFLPIVTELGIDPIHFGIIIVLNLCVGICTPPVGTLLFVGAAVGDTTITRLIRPLLPLYVAMVVSLLLVTYLPFLSLWLPRVFGF
jgi:tripartite ATP-independent transporter DctM subunit